VSTSISVEVDDKVKFIASGQFSVNVKLLESTSQIMFALLQSTELPSLWTSEFRMSVDSIPISILNSNWHRSDSITQAKFDSPVIASDFDFQPEQVNTRESIRTIGIARVIAKSPYELSLNSTIY
jgi:hypothetical protein